MSLSIILRKIPFLFLREERKPWNMAKTARGPSRSPRFLFDYRKFFLLGFFSSFSFFISTDLQCPVEKLKYNALYFELIMCSAELISCYAALTSVLIIRKKLKIQEKF